MNEGIKDRKYDEADWDKVRSPFMNSLLVDTSLNSLSENVELGDWPISGENETPFKYIYFSWEELNEMPGIAEHPERVDLLISILKETMAFDDPFGDMAAAVEESTDKDDSLGQALKEFNIPENFPLAYGSLSESTLEFCEGEGIQTIGEFAHFAESMAKKVVMGGDFKALLNALMGQDEQGLSRYLPYRPGTKGLHLIEGIALLVNDLSQTEHFSLLKRYGYKLTESQVSAARLNHAQIAKLEDDLHLKAKKLGLYFSDDLSNHCEQVSSGTSLERLFVVINDEEREVIARTILGRLIKESQDLSADEAPRRRGGFFAKLFKRK